ncbi:aldo/keto reductase [bacterium]|nr:MAG: aldo/keto reductase [bacterium]
MEIPRRKLGKTGVDVTILGLGGEGVLRTFGYEKEAYALINRALDLGINYCESARAYAGSETYYGKALRERRRDIFLTSKSHGRDKKGALIHLEETLKNLRTDYLDLWQVHDVRTAEEIEEIFSPDGAINAFIEARQKGRVRFIGVTGHHDPIIISKCLEMFDFDTVLIPVNPAEHAHKSFIDTIIPLARTQGMGVIGMKVYLRGLSEKLPFYETMKPFLNFALSQDVSTVVIGCDTVQQLEENITFARSFKKMGEEELGVLLKAVEPFAQRLMYYKQ